jgi:hypothetical protein
MSKSSFNVIAQMHQEMGSPGLLRCMEVLGDRYDDLSHEEREAYDGFYMELEAFVQQSQR